MWKKCSTVNTFWKHFIFVDTRGTFFGCYQPNKRVHQGPLDRGLFSDIYFLTGHGGTQLFAPHHESSALLCEGSNASLVCKHPTDFWKCVILIVGATKQG